MQRNRSWISDWDPENKEFWDSTAKHIAGRNLILPTLASQQRPWGRGNIRGPEDSCGFVGVGLSQWSA